MKVELEVVTKWYFLIPTITAVISLLWSICNFILGKAMATKILTNDFKHLTDDVKKLQEDEKDFKKEIRNDIKDIKDGIIRIERKQVARDAICEERHKSDKK